MESELMHPQVIGPRFYCIPIVMIAFASGTSGTEVKALIDPYGINLRRQSRKQAEHVVLREMP